MKFVAPMPEQIATTTIHLRSQESCVKSLHRQSWAKFFDMCPLAHQGNALLGSQLVLAWVQRISNFWSSDERLSEEVIKLISKILEWKKFAATLHTLLISLTLEGFKSYKGSGQVGLYELPTTISQSTQNDYFSLIV